MNSLLRTFSLQEVLHHPWRSAAAVASIMLGVALAFSVHLINASALSEFSSAMRSVNGQPDLELRAASGSLDEALYASIAMQPGVQLASPVLEVNASMQDAAGKRVGIKIVGVDALLVAYVAPALMPNPQTEKAVGGVTEKSANADTVGPETGPAPDSRFAMFAPQSVFLNPAARQMLAGKPLQLLGGNAGAPAVAAGSVAAGGPPIGVMDIGAAQDFFNQRGALSRIDLRLVPGTSLKAWLQSVQLPANVLVSEPGDAAQRVDNLSRAYRVNMTVLALVALFTGAFLVFSVLSLSVAKRAQQFALLGVLGLTARQRLRLVLTESALLGVVGSALGVGLGSLLAALALSFLGGDLGGGYFAGVAPALQWSTGYALGYGALGIIAALVGGWWPARTVQALPLAQTLKGLGSPLGGSGRGLYALLLIAVSAVLAAAPPVFGIALGAYIAVALLLLGGIGALPWAVGLLYDRLAPAVQGHLLPMLAVERARRVRSSAAVAVSGVVAALSLAVALTVMVASFRQSVTAWLDVVLPAPLYVRTTAAVSAGNIELLSPAVLARLAALPGVQRVAGLRIAQVVIDPSRPPVVVVARALDDASKTLPLVSGPVARNAGVPQQAIPIYVSEAMVDLYGAKLGYLFERNLPLAGVSIDKYATNTVATDAPAVNALPQDSGLPSPAFATNPAHPNTAASPIAPPYYVAGIWRDYARQFGTVAIELADYQRITGDQRINDLAIWLSPQGNLAQVKAAVSAVLAGQIASQGLQGSGQSTAQNPQDLQNLQGLVEFASSDEIRTVTLKIFDRSFAVTYWLQAVAIAIGLFGVAASFSAQVLARRKEFGLLAHLGFTRFQVLSVVAGEGAAWTAIGSIAGCALGLGVSVILVQVVNPQSFHWTMDMSVPWARLLALCAVVVVAGTAVAWAAGRAAAGHDAVLAVKEDW